VTPQAITIRYFWTSQQTYNAVRFMVFQWFDSGTPAVTGVIESNATTTGTLSPVLITNKQLLRSCMMRPHVIAPTAGGDATPIGYGASPAIKIYIPVSASNRCATIPTTNVVQDGNLFCLAISG